MSRLNGRMRSVASGNPCRRGCKLLALPTACCRYPHYTALIRLFRNRREQQVPITTEVGPKTDSHFDMLHFFRPVSARTPPTYRPGLDIASGLLKVVAATSSKEAEFLNQAVRCVSCFLSAASKNISDKAFKSAFLTALAFCDPWRPTR